MEYSRVLTNENKKKSKVLYQNVQVNEAVASTTSSSTWILINCLQPGDSRLF